jgi:thioredoxin reductase (NADPH)
VREKVYDVAVVGAGAAGLSAAIQAARTGLETLVLREFEAGGRVMLSDEMEGYTGAEEGATGSELASRMGAAGGQLLAPHSQVLSFTDLL